MNALQSTFCAAGIAGLLFVPGGDALAQAEPTALIDQHHCMFCHTTNGPFPAPSFHQIAERYRNKRSADVMLENKLRLGGKAHWGDMSMPLSADRGGPISPEDAHTLVQWVLSQ